MFTVKTIDETKRIIKNNFNDYSLEVIEIDASIAKGYVISEDIVSTENLPMFDRSTVDGYAALDSVVKHASSSSPVPLKLLGSSEMGKECTFELDETTTVYVPTGGHIPKGTTTMVMIEDTESLGSDILINKSTSRWENIFQKGTDIKALETVLVKNTKLNNRHIGVLKSLGIKKVKVYQKLKALIISTGDEITDNEIISLGQIRDINTYTISGYLDRYGIDVTKTIVINDDFDLYYDTVKKGFENNDLVISSGGSSVGEKDYTARVMEKLKAITLVHGVNIKPGKPTVISKYNNKLFFGLPGQPTSAYVVLNEMFDTIYNTIYNLKDVSVKPFIEGILDSKVHSKSGRKLYQIVSVTYGEEVIVTPLFAKSGMIKALSNAYGYIIINDNVEGIIKGEKVKVYRFGD
jgi:molybdopterin molybdotransferase